MKHRIRLSGVLACVILLLAAATLGTACTEPDTIVFIDAEFEGLRLTFPGPVEPESVGGWVYTWSGIQSTPEDGSPNISHIDVVVGSQECGEGDTWRVDGVWLDSSAGHTLSLVGVYSASEPGVLGVAEVDPVSLPSGGPLRIRLKYEDNGNGLQREAVLFLRGNFPKTIACVDGCPDDECSAGATSCCVWTDAPADEHPFWWCSAGADLPMDERFLERIRIVVPGT